MAMTTLVVRFLVELIGIAAVGYWGLQTSAEGFARVVLAVAASSALIVVWSVVVAPKATNGLSQPQRDVIGTALLLAAAGALAVAGQPTLALAFATVVVIDWSVMVWLGPAAVETVRPTAARGR